MPLALARALVASLLMGACGSPPPAADLSPASWAAAEAQIRSALQGSADAWNAADLKGHLAIYVDSATFMTSTGPRRGLAPTEEAFARTYWRDGRRRQNLRFEQAVVRPLGAGAALVTGRFILSGGGEPEQSGWFTLVWVRTSQGWRVVHDHSS